MSVKSDGSTAWIATKSGFLVRVDLARADEPPAFELDYFASSAQLVSDSRLLIHDISRSAVVLLDLDSMPPRPVAAFDVTAIGKLTAMAFDLSESTLVVGSLKGYVAFYRASHENGSVVSGSRCTDHVSRSPIRSDRVGQAAIVDISLADHSLRVSIADGRMFAGSIKDSVSLGLRCVLRRSSATARVASPRR